MAKLEGTKTLQNLVNAFAGESQARNRYTYYASIAKKEGFLQIEAIFLETADNEKEHAKLFYKYIAEGLGGARQAVTVHVDADYPVAYGDTYENLIAAAAGEREEWTILYNHFGDIAEAEGFDDIATTFREVAEVEERHEARYLKLAANVKEGKVFKKDKSVQWKCGNCGYIAEGPEAPLTCPACKHPRAHFEVWCETY